MPTARKMTMLFKPIRAFADRTGDRFQWRKPERFGTLCELSQNDAVFAMLWRDNLLALSNHIRTSQGLWRLESAGVVHPEWTIKGAGGAVIATGRYLGPFGIGHKAEIQDSNCRRFLWRPRNVLGTSYEFISEGGEALILYRRPMLEQGGRTNVLKADLVLQPAAFSLAEATLAMLATTAYCLEPS